MSLIVIITCSATQSSSKLPSFEERRVRGDLIETFKLLKGIDKLDFRLCFKFSVNSKVTYKIVKNNFRLDVMKIVFSNRVVDAWNELPQYMWLVQKLNSVKARLDIPSSNVNLMILCDVYLKV